MSEWEFKPMDVRQCLEAICGEFERAVEYAERTACGTKSPGGQQASPETGDFIGAARIPSTVGRMRWWAREFRRALDDEKLERE